ncbi:MAG: DMT family transporter [Candidatus Babeliales bacterium]
MFLVIVLYMLMASTFTFAKAALFYAPPILFIGVRMTLAGIMLLSYLWFRSPSQLHIERKHWHLIAQIILFHIYGAYIFEFVGLRFVSSSKACLLYNLMPFITALFSYLLLGTRLTRTQMIALCIGFLGFIPMMFSTSAQEISGGSLLGISTGELLIIGSVCCAVQGWMVMKILVRSGYSPITINGMGMLVGGVLALITSLLVEGMPHLVQQQGELTFPLHTWLAQYNGSPLFMCAVYTVLLIIIANIIAYNLYGYLLRTYSATFMSFAGFTAPLFAVVYGWLLLGETVTAWFFVSLIIVFYALYLFYQDELGTNT